MEIITRGDGFDIVKENNKYYEIDYDYRDGIASEIWIPLTKKEAVKIFLKNFKKPLDIIQLK